MAQPHSKQPAPSADYKTIAAEYARAKRAKEASDAAKQQQQQQQQQQDGAPKTKANASELQRKAFEARRKSAFGRRWWWAVGFWLWLLSIHAVGILLFTSGFLLTRMVLDEKSACAVPPVEPAGRWKGMGTVEGGCWHPKSFDKAVVVIIDALRYDFTVPVADNAPFHNAFPFLHETALRAPQNAFLRPFIADPPTATLQRLKGLTTGTLPTFIDAGSNFAGTAIEEDNLLMQMKGLGQRIVHIGDDTWVSLFPDYFEPNISRAYDSFNVWDLHTVDTGVIDHLAPLLQPENKGKWDVLIGHLLGVDHAGHRYGPDHPAMKAKLEQMDAWLRDLSTQIDDDTVLIVMGDHGMDEKGDHGGESDDEVEAALWMYSKRPFFGRTDPNHAQPPATGKERPVNQIDLVPTLALLLGIPIPFNNLGGPIEEAFAGVKGNDWANLAAVSRISAAGTQRYQDSYFAARGMESSSKSSPTHASWTQAHGAWATKSWPASYQSFRNFQEETLQVCKDLWARFDVPKMITGIIVMAAGVIMLLVYASRDEDEDFAATDIELDFAEKKLELQGIVGAASPEYTQLHKNIVVAALVGAIPGAFAGAAGSQLLGVNDLTYAAAAAAFASIVAALVALTDAGKGLLNILPTSVWGWLSVLFPVSQSVGFASNSYTIWEDSILLFFISTFGAISAVASCSIPSPVERTLAVYHSVLFIVLGRVASFSKLCREEQMPYCTSTYYASSSSSTSAGWQLLIPFVVAFALPAIIKSFLVPSRSWEGLGPTWIGYIYRAGLFMAALYWVLDAADNGDWVPGLPEQTLKTIAVYVAQLVLALVFVAGTTAFVWAPPLVSVVQSRAPDGSNKVVILGYGNTNGARYLLLPMNLLAGCILLSKPMGGGALALVFWQTMSLMEILDLNGLTAESIGPVMLALLGNFAYFKTGHQATPSSIQWDSAFIPLFTIRYPWTPIVVALNHFGAQIIAASAVPLVVLWKVGPKRKGVLESASRALAAFVSFFAVESLATMAWAGHLRRHLMLYRVFCPRFMMGAVLLLVVDLVCIVVTLAGVRSNTLSLHDTSRCPSVPTESPPLVCKVLLAGSWGKHRAGRDHLGVFFFHHLPPRPFPSVVYLPQVKSQSRPSITRDTITTIASQPLPSNDLFVPAHIPNVSPSLPSSILHPPSNVHTHPPPSRSCGLWNPSLHNFGFWSLFSKRNSNPLRLGPFERLPCLVPRAKQLYAHSSSPTYNESNPTHIGPVDITQSSRFELRPIRNITFATMAANGNFTAQEQYKGNADQSSVAAATDSSPSSASNANLSKDEVGWYFVEQYYTTLSKTPEKLHLFYGKRSQFVYGKEAEVATVSVGRNAIQERIKELDFQDCKVRVTNVDSMASFDNIVIQVIGETSNKAAEPQKFVQTFVLAPQPSGYFVVNDILRFVNEEGEEEAVVETQEEQVNIEPSPPAAEAEKAPVEAEEETKEEAAIDADEVDKKLEDSVEETAASTDEAASNADEAKAEEPVEAVPEAAAETNPEAVAAEVAQDDVKEAEKPADPSPTPVAPPAKAEKPVAAVPAKHMSWASRAAAAVGPKAAVPLPKAAVPAAKSAAPASATPAATAPAAASPQPSAAVQQPTESKEASQAATEWQSVSDSKRQNRPQSISGPPTENKDTLGYVKYVTDKVKTEDLRAALAAHGELTYFDVNRQKNCAFVEFATAAGYQAAAAANPHTVNGETIHVEARRPKAGAYGGSNYASGRGGAPSRGRGGFEGQRQGSQGGGRGNFTGGQGRGRGAPRGRGASQAATNA